MTLPLLPPRPAALLLLRRAAALLLAASAALLVACASKPPVPDWQMNAHAAAEKALAAYLSGDDRVEALEWDRARAEVSRTGRPGLLARLELMRCAAQAASLVAAPCERFEALRPDAGEEERAYGDYLAGLVRPEQLPLLPEAQRKAAAAAGASSATEAAALAGMEDPLSRLVAAGVLFRTGRASPQVLAAATETASAQGWRRPLMAWLLLQRERAQAAGDGAAVAALQRRIAIVERQGQTPR